MIIPACLLPVVALIAAPRSAFADQQRILEAIRFVESGGRIDPPDGDGGKAIGPFQIHREYWQDAHEFDAALGGEYENCRDAGYAIDVVRAYMKRYAPDAWRRGDAEVVARTHNGGPRGRHKQATEGYWHKVRRLLEVGP